VKGSNGAASGPVTASATQQFSLNPAHQVTIFVQRHLMNKEEQADTELSLDALRAGDRNEFARLVDLYSGKIYRLALQITGNTQDAEDVLQETFLKAFHALPAFEGRSSLSTWLYRIAVNEALMILRRQKAQFSLEDSGNGEEEKVENLQLVDWCCLPEDELQSAETRHVLDEAIQRLSPVLQLVFLLRDVEGLSV
jgi:RNA polymerase sigma-70 factor (ECF subfamily)